ncbi:RNA 2',3'-cyclic phosphate--5'-hydroxyl ligase [Flavobacterium akiainvivens]|uniref:3'-phosphate/5'-hydroxy nucleic acid ligase n=1 Tax=Flavobacterium akiainvivens TaxID=1202724 RepID=A0A0M9VHM2_9FLAO|nr:RtcB family protein [Flavobacterium akiainvivens]KOS05712.1 RNA 2',3'-cyclic phosphate--5'-hydroxyl ligase [Flavobacterium akiainvivens]SFQ37130.1 tRNA-splicing ligase RtcB [Flavobacterium akiainvivens]
MSTPINGNDLIALGYTEGAILGIALKINRGRNGFNREQMMEHYAAVLASPEDYLDHKVFAKLAVAMIEKANEKPEDFIALNENPDAYSVYGADYIEEGAQKQMQVAMKLPVTVAGALMPDAHQGYGLPIGGVLATKNAIIPYGVGVDIGCRMALSVYDIPEDFYYENEHKFKRELIAHSKFGAGHGFTGQYKSDHLVLQDAGFDTNPFIKNLKDKAWSQLGTSGGGNHFVEFGIMEFEKDDAILNIPKGRYVALLTHSGSRGFGATIAGHYTKLAKDVCKLPEVAQNLAYLDLNSDLGQEYWIAMNLAGDYASACHEIIHNKMERALGATVLAKVENHHNFAWKEMYNGEEVIVHRKGATPAAEGVMGIIPGSMTAPGFLVRGKGEANALNSASHGAGRQMSRTQAIKNITKNDMKAILKDHGVTLIGAGLDEAPMAYKDINLVMASQQELVDVVAKFTPKMVRMADDGSRED